MQLWPVMKGYVSISEERTATTVDAQTSLRDVLELQFPNDERHRWTYHFNANEQIDYILVSDRLADHLGGRRRRTTGHAQHS